MKFSWRTALGYFLLFLALVGFLLPLMPGWVFFFAAVGVLGAEHFIIKWCRKHMQRFGIWKDEDLPPGGPPA